MHTRSSATRLSALPIATPGAFHRLPDEILLEIIRYVRTFSVLEYKQLRSDKEEHLHRRGVTFALARQKFAVWTYQTPESSPSLSAPILNTFQALATVNRRIYALSRPLLWEVISRPFVLVSA